MHELSIAQAIADVAIRHAAGRRVRRVELTVGHLRQVVPEALAFSFKMITEGTELAGAELVLTIVPAAGRCQRCGVVSELSAFPFKCSACSGSDLRVIRGEELLVDALEVDKEMEKATDNEEVA